MKQYRSFILIDRIQPLALADPGGAPVCVPPPSGTQFFRFCICGFSEKQLHRNIGSTHQWDWRPHPSMGNPGSAPALAI